MQVLLAYLVAVTGFLVLGVIKAEIVCDPPPVFERTITIDGNEMKASYPRGTIFVYKCQPGYVSEKVLTLSKCMLAKDNRTAEWTKPNIHCKKIHCGPPTYLENGQAIYSSTEYETELKYQCNDGYRLNSQQSRICTAEGTWSGIDPVCSDDLCEFPIAPENGFFNLMSDVPRIDSIVVYSCNDSFRLEGSAISKCNETGEWTTPTPKCIQRCEVPDVCHGKIGISRNMSRFERFGYVPRGYNRFETIFPETIVDDGEFILRCYVNYEIIGSGAQEEKVECKGGSWSDNLRCVPVSCHGPPPFTKNANITLINKQHGGTVVYTCDTNFLKTKNGSVKCKFGNWTGITPICTDNLTAVDKGPFSSTWYTRLRGCKVPIVQNGALMERRLAERKFNSSMFRFVQEIFFEIPIGTDVPSRAKRYLKCFEGYSVHGAGRSNTSLICLRGKWHPRPICRSNSTEYMEEEDVDMITFLRRPELRRQPWLRRRVPIPTFRETADNQTSNY